MIDLSLLFEANEYKNNYSGYFFNSKWYFFNSKCNKNNLVMSTKIIYNISEEYLFDFFNIYVLIISGKKKGVLAVPLKFKFYIYKRIIPYVY